MPRIIPIHEITAAGRG